MKLKYLRLQVEQKSLPARFSNDHFICNVVEFLPKFKVLQNESHCVTRTVFTFNITGVMKSIFKGQDGIHQDQNERNDGYMIDVKRQTLEVSKMNDENDESDENCEGGCLGKFRLQALCVTEGRTRVKW